MGVTGTKKSASLHLLERRPVVSIYLGEESRPIVERHLICHSGREEGHGRLVGAGSSRSGYVGDGEATQRLGLCLSALLHKNSECYPGLFQLLDIRQATMALTNDIAIFLTFGEISR
jgi:hypothetical protein